MLIVFVLNKAYEQMTQNAINTVRKHNIAKICCLINKDVSHDFRTKHNCIEYNADLLDEFKTDLGYKHISIDAYAKLLIPKYLNEKVLYLDGDIICRGSLSELWNEDFEENYIVGCEGIDYSRVQANELDIPFYINSGVMLMNCELMNKDSYFEKIKKEWKLLKQKPKTWSHDETIINGIFNHKIKLVNEKFNYCHNRPYVGREVNDPVILHFAGGNKKALLDSM